MTPQQIQQMPQIGACSSESSTSKYGIPLASIPLAGIPLADVLKKDENAWHISKMNVEELLNNQNGVEQCIIFTASSIFVESQSLRERLSHRYTIPACFWTELSQKGNGFFGCQDNYNGEGEVESYNTWFKFIIKHTTRGASKQTPSGNICYEWFEMGFITKWLPPRQNVVLWFDPPCDRDLPGRLKIALNRDNSGFYDPYSLHMAIAGEILNLYDNSVWSLRDLIRDIELNRVYTPPQNREQNRVFRFLRQPNHPHLNQPDYPQMHDIARHVIHSSETLDVAIETLDSMITQHKVFVSEMSPKAMATFRRTEKYLQFQSKVFRALKSRSQALGERLRNEINLAFNTVAQYDSRTARTDSAVMKTIAILTLIFLPGSYISTIFSMSFYNFSPGSETQPQKWSVSKDIWIYWAISVPLTVVTVASWLMWQRWQGTKTISS